MPLDLAQCLADRLAACAAGPLAVAFSGGLDSTVLLHALAALPHARSRGLRALHVDHRLQAVSGEWAAHCAAFGAGLGLEVELLVADVRPAGDGLEAAARAARYAALIGALREGETLVLAQHRDDQAETVLLRLLRGAGSAGLAAMTEHGLRDGVRLWRPLLDLPRCTLLAYAEQHGLRWIEDPSNCDLRHRRNHLRHRVLPALREQWPQAAAALAASARLLAEDAVLIDAMAESALADVRGLDPRTLSTPRLAALPSALLRHVLRRWLRECRLPSPPASILLRVGPELLAAAADGEPRLRWAGASLTRYRDLLYCSHDVDPLDTDWECSWDGSQVLQLPTGFGRLQLTPAPLQLLPMRVRPRQGGERIRLPNRSRSSTLKKVLQALAIPPWERRRLPLVFSDDGELLAAGDLALSGRLVALLDEHASTLRWQPPDDD
jgi:tRNA(Ile)-lysidine synthase